MNTGPYDQATECCEAINPSAWRAAKQFGLVGDERLSADASHERKTVSVCEHPAPLLP
jgi:hypothetical protein